MKYRYRFRVLAGVVTIVFIATIIVFLIMLRIHSATLADPNTFYPPHGMTKRELQNMLSPSRIRRNLDGTETWLYHCDSFGLTMIGVEFDLNGQVVSTYNH